ncbi:hypothetical protein SAMN05421759_102545 [Roseivivax lentus]|uniref:Uncharacterized protein n=1 Tax=Roseivivax lentus TaxID=633194 RepID=A0A1N7LBE5_9RHOB|nr:hypothetical protein [Roseivivax lentus]SIS71117.1 hypothetical protein SAMN05421759_102545 [Roseivivax lentus]
MKHSFSAWLTSTRDADLTELRAVVQNAPAEWEDVETLPQAQARIEALAGVDDQTRRARQMDLARAFLSFEKARARPRGVGLLSFGPSVFALMAIVLGVISFGIFSKTEPTLLDQLSDTETARGLITFIFALGVMSLALIIVSASFISDGSRPHAFDRAKEVFTSLVAILGTILGFYFGVGEAERLEEAQANAAQSSLVAPNAPQTGIVAPDPAPMPDPAPGTE